MATQDIIYFVSVFSTKANFIFKLNVNIYSSTGYSMTVLKLVLFQKNNCVLTLMWLAFWSSEGYVSSKRVNVMLLCQYSILHKSDMIQNKTEAQTGQIIICANPTAAK